jgi:membrane-bound lytic murein transglycosylase D
MSFRFFQFFLILFLGLVASSCSTKKHSGYSSSRSSERIEPPSNPVLFQGEYEAERRGELPELEMLYTRNAKVEQWMAYFQGRGRKWFRIWLERSGRYIPFMRKVLREHGLPEDLVYLAMIESGFSSRAYSRARAVGYWQFMQATGRSYGLQVNFWVDERRDPERASIAAARHLKDLYDRFQDWKLAAAAYNAGAGKISRAIRRYKTEDFWELTKQRYLARETKNYVPKLIAAALIAREPEKYGFRGIEYKDPLEYDKVVLDRPVNLKILAQRANVNLQSLLDLNPELNHPVTPPYEKDYELRVPSRSSQKFLEAYKTLGPEDFFKYANHRVRRGETISQIARHYGVPQREIFRMNKIRSAKGLQIGQNLILPIPDGIDYKVPRQSLARSERRPVYRTAQKTGIHNVARGDTLWQISRAYGVSIESIKQANGMRRSHLYRGEKLKIPGYGGVAQESAGGEDLKLATKSGFHVVRSGDTLWGISKRYGVGVKDLRAQNGLRSDALALGQRLKIPARSGNGVRGPIDSSFHVVKQGESLWSIAQKYGTSIREIKRVNDLRRNRIYPGKKLTIPST